MKANFIQSSCAHAFIEYMGSGLLLLILQQGISWPTRTYRFNCVTFPNHLSNKAPDESIRFDIIRFGSMMYDIVSGHRHEFYINLEIESDLDDSELETHKEWPTSEQFPDTGNLSLGYIIHKCWIGDGFCRLAFCTCFFDERNGTQCLLVI